MTTEPARLSPATIAVSAGRPTRSPGASVNEPVWLTSTYVADGPVDYGRTDNPTWRAFEATLGALEGGDALVFASGMGAISAACSLVPDGSVVVVPQHAYSGTSALLLDTEKAGRVTLRRVDIADAEAVAQAAQGAAMVWLESPTNPMLEVADLRACAAAARDAGALSVVDNTFATPLVQQPLALGADVVVHSVTKFLAGHSDVVLGAAVTGTDERGREIGARLRRHRLLGGAIAGPQEVFLALRGVRTLALRMERAQANATELAHRLSSHPAVSRVRHPSLPDDPGHTLAAKQMLGPGAILAIEVSDAEEAERVCNATALWLHATSLGGVESTLERRRRHGAEAQTVPESLLRLSVGIEDVEDLWADLDQALRG